MASSSADGEAPRPYRAPIDLERMPADRVRPARRSGVRPVEQRLDEFEDGYEREVIPVHAGLQRTADRGERGRDERRLDAELGALDPVAGIVAVMSCAGGVGKSTIALALAELVAAAGRGPVALVDCEPEIAGLSLLVGDGGRMTRLIADPPEEPEACVTRLRSGVDLFAAGHHAPVLQVLIERPEAVRGIGERLRAHYPVVIFDVGAGVQHPIARSVAECCDVVILVARASITGVAGTILSYRYLRTSRALVDPEAETSRPTRVGAVINNVTEGQRPELELLRDEMLASGLDAIVVDGDPVLADAVEQGGCGWEDCASGPRQALKRLAVTVASALVRLG
jgi:MinD-like ATPase involved in chromosome partitioning or flagellar assembly